MSNASLASLNGPNAGAVEGWRAVLSVVLRYGIGQRQRISQARSFLERSDVDGESVSASGSGPPSVTVLDEEDMDVDGINAMIAGVKSRGVGYFSFHISCYILINFVSVC